MYLHTFCCKVWALIDHLPRELQAEGTWGSSLLCRHHRPTSLLLHTPSAQGLAPCKGSQLRHAADPPSRNCGVCSDIILHPLPSPPHLPERHCGAVPAFLPTPPSLGCISQPFLWPSHSGSPFPMGVWWSALLRADKGGLGCYRERKQHPAGGPRH